MIRTQIYITDEERSALTSLAQQTGLSQSELIRQAIDHFCQLHKSSNKLERLRKAKGIWENRDDFCDFKDIRASFDRKRKK